MNFDSYERPVWQLPVGNEGGYIYKSAKYPCFVDNKSLCGRYDQCTDFYDDGITVDSGEIVHWPQIACKKCRERWLQIYREEESAP